MMNNTQTKKISISDYKILIHSIKENYSIDFSDYSLGSLKRRIELFSTKYYFDTINELIYRLNNDKKFFQLFLKTILVDSTEMFRDSEFWIELKELITEKSKTNTDLKIWLPYCNSGEELYSLLILLDKLKLISKTNIVVSSLSPVLIKRIQEASLEIKSMELNNANYERTNIGRNLLDLFIKKTYYYELNRKLFLNTEINQYNIVLEEVNDKFDIILFRNKMLYFNKQLSNKIMIKLKNSLKYNGLLALGVKENINYSGYEKDFSKISNSEKIYTKKLTE